MLAHRMEPSKPLKILLVGNYLPDAQPSMLEFAALMEKGLREAGHSVRKVSAPTFFGARARRSDFIKKWTGYIDKLLLFPTMLNRSILDVDLVHICDHSNALYIPRRKHVPFVITCHDLLAIRGSMGEQTDCPPSRVGGILQQWILAGIQRADAIACVSKTTLADVSRLISGERPTKLVPLALRQNLEPSTPEDSARRLESIPGLDRERPFILHVGSSHKRKNREGVLRVFARVCNDLNAQLVLVGKPLEASQRELARNLGVHGRIIETGTVSDELLAALYARALVFLFPSRFEGFGWPIVEAQACGCPVLCSNRPPLPEVAGNGALIRGIEDESGFAADIMLLSSHPALRSQLIERGRLNALRYRLEPMIASYISLYERVLKSSEGIDRSAVPVTV